MKATANNDYTTAKEVKHSFILRCWNSPEGLKRLRLINTQTGQEYILEDIEQLTELINTIMADSWDT